MKYLSLIFSFLLLLIFNIDSFSQNIVSSNINHNSATISFPNTEGQNLNLHIFTQNVDDTIAFFEDFSKLPKVPRSNHLFNSKIALNLPYSYTLVSGCQGRNIYSTYRDT